MRTFQYIITLTVDDSYGPMSPEQIDAMFDHVHPTSTVVEYGSEPDDHFFIETIDVKEVGEQGWISVEDRLPTKGGDYLVTDGVSQMVARLHLSGVWDFFDNHVWWHSNHVTHWMPLIESPLQ
jgi:hypothetical protein